MQNDPHVEVLHVVQCSDDKPCPEGPVCPAAIRVDGLDGETAIVGRLVTDPAIARSLNRHIGPGEGVLLVPDELLDMIRKGAA